MAPDPQQAPKDDSPAASTSSVEEDDGEGGEATSSDPTTSTMTVLAHRQRSESDLKKILLDQYVNRDLIHSAAMNDNHYRWRDYSRRKSFEIEDYKTIARPENRHIFTPAKIYGEGYSGFGNGRTDGPSRVIYPHMKPRLGHRKTRLLRIKRKDLAVQADQVEELVPIRLEVDWDKIKLRDTFTWNLHDRTVPPELFATQLIEDLGLALPAANPVLDQVQQQLHEQIVDFYPPVYIEEDALDPELPYSAYKNDEMRILIKLHITIGALTLEDRFEWEINNPLNSPEEFAKSMGKDLSLSGEFITAIAHCIREQVQLFTRSLYIIGHPFDGRPLEDADLIASFLPSPLPSVFRPYQQARDYMPYLSELSEAEFERNEVIFSREQRRQKRSVNRRGGPTLPDLKDRQRTVRTLVVSSVLPGAADRVEDSRLYKRVGGAAGRGKRATLRDGDLSDSSESEESAPESPAMSQLQSGTARTRGMRGAATAAQQRMANLGRSETPEATIVHHHETRTSARRFGRNEREETLDDSTFIVKLKMPKERFRKWVRELKTGRPSNLQATPSFTRAQSQSHSTPVIGSMGPPSTPGVQNQPAPAAPNTAAAAAAPQGQIGGLPAPFPVMNQPPPQAPPPPAWLSAGLNALKTQYPTDRFEGMMRYSAVNIETQQAVPNLPANQPTPDGIKYMFLPRIRCHDCPGKLYTPGPDTTVGNFEVHLKNRLHRERVDGRVTLQGNGNVGF